jgi:dimeric dUTPase (all-alpha-NTP-PPase superfamily)
MVKKDTAVKENVLALIVEAVEVLNEVNWKSWRVQQQAINKEALVDELADLFHFFCNILLAADVTEAEFDKAWNKSVLKIVERIENGY